MENQEDHPVARGKHDIPVPESPKEIRRRISAELVGDAAIEAEMLETILRLADNQRSKLARDSALVNLAIQALGRAIEDCRRETNIKFPTPADLEQFLTR